MNFGGILLVCDELRYKVSGTIEGSYTISENNLGWNGASWWLTTIYIYGPTKRNCRDDLWEDLNELSTKSSQAWLIGGDLALMSLDGGKKQMLQVK